MIPSSGFEITETKIKLKLFVFKNLQFYPTTSNEIYIECKKGNQNSHLNEPEYKAICLHICSFDHGKNALVEEDTHGQMSLLESLMELVFKLVCLLTKR